jgi:hypothetical protein
MKGRPLTRQVRRERIRTEGRKDHKGLGVAFPRTELGLDRDWDVARASATYCNDEEFARIQACFPFVAFVIFCANLLVSPL